MAGQRRTRGHEHEGVLGDQPGRPSPAGNTCGATGRIRFQPWSEGAAKLLPPEGLTLAHRTEEGDLAASGKGERRSAREFMVHLPGARAGEHHAP